MNILQLEQKLKELSVRKDSYSLYGGFPNEAYCVSQFENTWEVYYSERGLKTNMKIFSDEASACEYFFHLLIKNVLKKEHLSLC